MTSNCNSPSLAPSKTGSSGSSLGCDSKKRNILTAPLLSSKTPFGSQHGGSGVAPYAVTKTTEGGNHNSNLSKCASTSRDRIDRFKDINLLTHVVKTVLQGSDVPSSMYTPRPLEPDLNKRMIFFIRDQQGHPRLVRNPCPVQKPRSDLKKVFRRRKTVHLNVARPTTRVLMSRKPVHLNVESTDPQQPKTMQMTQTDSP